MLFNSVTGSIWRNSRTYLRRFTSLLFDINVGIRWNFLANKNKVYSSFDIAEGHLINFTSRNFSPLCKSELMIEGQLMKLTIFHNYLERGNNLQHHRQLPSQHNAGKIGKKIYNNHTAPKSEIFMFVSINTPNNAVMP